MPRFDLIFLCSGDRTIYNFTDPNGFAKVLGPDGTNNQTKVSFVVHGWLGRCDCDWPPYLTKTLTKFDNSVSCCLDWSPWAQRSYCDNVRRNIYIVGKYLGRILKILNGAPYSVPVLNFILLGHSFGSHIMGYAGKQFTSPKIPYCIALDPAGIVMPEDFEAILYAVICNS